jgi:hypothetical protein
VWLRTLCLVAAALQATQEMLERKQLQAQFEEMQQRTDARLDRLEQQSIENSNRLRAAEGALKDVARKALGGGGAEMVSLHTKRVETKLKILASELAGIRDHQQQLADRIQGQGRGGSGGASLASEGYSGTGYSGTGYSGAGYRSSGGNGSAPPPSPGARLASSSSAGAAADATAAGAGGGGCGGRSPFPSAGYGPDTSPNVTSYTTRGAQSPRSHTPTTGTPRRASFAPSVTSPTTPSRRSSYGGGSGGGGGGGGGDLSPPQRSDVSSTILNR